MRTRCQRPPQAGRRWRRAGNIVADRVGAERRRAVQFRLGAGAGRGGKRGRLGEGCGGRGEVAGGEVGLAPRGEQLTQLDAVVHFAQEPLAGVERVPDWVAPAPARVQAAQSAELTALARAVADLAVDGEGALEVLARLVYPAPSR